MNSCKPVFIVFTSVCGETTSKYNTGVTILNKCLESPLAHYGREMKV